MISMLKYNSNIPTKQLILFLNEQNQGKIVLKDLVRNIAFERLTYSTKTFFTFIFFTYFFTTGTMFAFAMTLSTTLRLLLLF